MKRLSKEQILMLHSQLIEQFDGSDGVRDYNLLESALETPFQSFAGEELYPTIQAKAARLGYGLIKNHSKIDGNKRIGAHAMLVFLAINGIELDIRRRNSMKRFYLLRMEALIMRDFLSGSWNIRNSNKTGRRPAGYCPVFYARRQEVTSRQHTSVDRGLVSRAACFRRYE